MPKGEDTRQHAAASTRAEAEIGAAPVKDEDIVAITKRINFARVSERIRASSEDFRERHRASQDDLSLEMSF